MRHADAASGKGCVIRVIFIRVPLNIVLFAVVTYFCALSFPQHARAEISIELLEQAEPLILKGDYETAEHNLLSVLMLEPQNQKALLLMGISLRRRGDKEAASYLKRALYLNPGDPRVNLELGGYYYGQGVYQEAIEFLERAIELSEEREPAIANKAAQYIGEIETYMRAVDSRKKSLELNATAGMEYDTNVPALSDDTQPLQVPSRNDTRLNIMLRGAYNKRFIRNKEAGVSYTFHRSFHSDLSQYDTEHHTATLKGALRKGKTVLELRYIIFNADVDGFRHTRSQALSPSLILPVGSDSSAIITYRYSDNNSFDLPVSPTNAGRTGHSHMAGVTGIRQISDSYIIRFGYIYDTLSARDVIYKYSGHKAYASAELAMGPKTVAALKAEFYHRDFGGPLGGRHEQRYTASAAASWRLGDKTSFGISGTYVNNKSDYGQYEYNRAITGLFIKARY